ncbi:hypothetical protein SDC9_148079 [bioreactor metagenome]|uniref:Uncharacterized protein n=1 Tax=bioreactor metagenome TaxID=1076179 RepID=A0A645EG44_9ZZZZ
MLFRCGDDLWQQGNILLLQRDNDFVYARFGELIVARLLPGTEIGNIRKRRSMADITVDGETKTRIFLDGFDVLFRKRAIADQNHML